jgi:hypothetical protein
MMLLSLRPSLFTTWNSISPFLSSITAGFSGNGTMRLVGGATSEGVSEVSFFGRFEGEPESMDWVALRLAGGELMLARAFVGACDEEDEDCGVRGGSGETSREEE